MKKVMTYYKALWANIIIAITTPINLKTAGINPQLDAAYTTIVHKSLNELTQQEVSFATSTTSPEIAALKFAQQKNVYNLLLNNFKPDYSTIAQYLPFATYDYLNLISSKPNKPSWFSFLNNAVSTKCGSAVLTQLLLHPVAAHNLENRQAVIRHFYNLQKRSDLMNDLQKNLAAIQQELPHYFHIYEDQYRTISKDGFLMPSKAEKLNKKLYYSSLPVGNDSLNNSSLALEAAQTGRLAWSGIKIAALPVMAYMAYNNISYLASGLTQPFHEGADEKNPKQPVNPLYQDYQKQAGQNMQAIKQDALAISNYFGNGKLVSQALSGSLAATQLLQQTDFIKYTLSALGNRIKSTAEDISNIFGSPKDQASDTNYIHEQLIHLSTLVRHLKKINTLLISPNTKLQSLLPSVMHIKALFEESSTQISPEMSELIKLLLTNTFTGTASFFSLKGRILLAYKKFQACYKEFIPVLHTLGEIDAYNACAKICYNSQKNNNKFSLIKISKEKELHFTAEQLWDLTTKKDFFNNINTTTNKPFITSNQTVWYSILRAAILANTLAIAPCTSCTLTPTTIFTLLNSSEAAFNYTPTESKQYSFIGYNGLLAQPDQAFTALNKLIMPKTMIIAALPKES